MEPVTRTHICKCGEVNFNLKQKNGGVLLFCTACKEGGWSVENLDVYTSYNNFCNQCFGSLIKVKLIVNNGKTVNIELKCSKCGELIKKVYVDQYGKIISPDKYSKLIKVDKIIKLEKRIDELNNQCEYLRSENDELQEMVNRLEEEGNLEFGIGEQLYEIEELRSRI